MKYGFQILILTIITNWYSSLAQDVNSIDILKDDIEFMLPPLETLIDSAIANNPNVKFSDLQITVNRYKLRADRTLWTKNLGIQTDIRYGTFDNFSTNTSEGQNPSLIASRSNQMNYGAGAYIKLPFYEIVNRKNQINIDEAEIEQAKYFSLVQQKELRQTVIKQYNDLIVRQRILKIKSRYAETSRINMQMVEKEFSNGIISVSEYASIAESVSRTETDFETSRMDFLTTFMILEEIVGIKFNLTK